MIPSTSREKVAEAAKMMDIEVPGWYNLINLDTFEMAYCHTCVLGQVFGKDMEGKLTKILSVESPAKNVIGTGYSNALSYLRERGYGGEKYPHIDGSFGADTCEWAEEIATRRALDEVNNSNNNQMENQNVTAEQ